MDDLLQRSLRRTRDLTLGGVIFFLLFALAAFGIGFLDWDIVPLGEQQRPIIGGFFAVLMLALGLFFLYRLLAQFPGFSVEQSPILQTLYKNPRKIVWIYAHDTIYRGIRTVTVYMWMDDGHSFFVGVNPEETEAFIQSIAKRTPKAHIGFDPETQKRYQANPAEFGLRK